MELIYLIITIIIIIIITIIIEKRDKINENNRKESSIVDCIIEKEKESIVVLDPINKVGNDVKSMHENIIKMHNQKVSFLKNTIGFVFFTIVTTILLFCYSSTVYLERTHNGGYSFADYEKPKAAFIITSVLSSLVTIGFMSSMLGSLKHIKSKND